MNKETVAATDVRVTFNVSPLAVSIEEAARIVGLSLTTFRTQYIDAGLVKSISYGIQGRVIDLQELSGAYQEWKRRRDS